MNVLFVNIEFGVYFLQYDKLTIVINYYFLALLNILGPTMVTPAPPGLLFRHHLQIKNKTKW